jgi:hypothetical protein
MHASGDVFPTSPFQSFGPATRRAAFQPVAQTHQAIMSAVAFQNLTAVWHGIFTKLGLNVVVVQMDTRRASPVHSHPEIEVALGLELQQVQAGFFDSAIYPGTVDIDYSGTAWFFFHCIDLGKAMSCLKSQIAARGLLGITNILHAESENELRAWWAYEPENIGKLFTFES